MKNRKGAGDGMREVRVQVAWVAVMVLAGLTALGVYMGWVVCN